MNLRTLAEKFPEIISLVQFGSSISGDTYGGSDIDLLVVVKDKEDKEKIEKGFREKLDWEYQTHFYARKSENR